MLTLALDTSTSVASLAVLRDDNVLGTFSTNAPEFHSAQLFRHLESLLDELSLALDRFELFAVANGPGSFTGVRIGLSAVKAWGEVFGRPVAAISTLEAQAEQSASISPVVASVLDARRGQVYCGYYRWEGGANRSCLVQEGPESVMGRQEFREDLLSRCSLGDVCIVTSAPALVSDILSQGETPGEPSRLIPIHPVSAILAPSVGRLGYLCACHGRVTNSLNVDANYIRRSDAELHLKGSLHA